MAAFNNNTRILISGDYPLLEYAFIDEIKSLRKEDRFAPVLILVSSKLLEIHLRRFLVDQGVAHFNLRFKTLEELAWEVCTPRLLSQGKKELPRYAHDLIIGEIAQSLAQTDKDFYFQEISDRPGLHRALLATIKDLKDGGLKPKDLEDQLQNGQIAKQLHLHKLQHFIKIWQRYEDTLENLKTYDEADLMTLASKWVKDFIHLRYTPKLFIYGFYDFNAAQKRLIQACVEEKPTTIFIPYEPTPAFEFARPTWQWFKDLGFKETLLKDQTLSCRSPSIQHSCLHLFHAHKPKETSAEGIQIISAPGETREARELVRIILNISKREGIPFHEIGIILRNPEEYSRILREILESLGIKAFIREGIPLLETRAGKSLILLLNIANQNFSRQSVMEFVTFAKLRPDQFCSPEGCGLNPPLWDSISIKAGIVEGEEEWGERLQRLRQSWIEEVGQAEEDEEKGPMLKENLLALEQLIQFTQKLFSLLKLLARAKTWTEKVKTLLQTLEEFLPQTDEEILVHQALRKLSELDLTGIPPSLADFSRIVKEVLQEEVIPRGRFQRNGPTVVNLMAARGVPFKVLILPGMVEKSFPPLIKQDAILLDQERKIINRAISGKENEPLSLKAEARLKEERLLFRLAVGAAQEKLILSFPRVEMGTGRERLPSSFLLALVEVFTGKAVDFQQLEQFPGFRRIPLAQIAVSSAEEAIWEMEYDLAVGQEKLKEKKPTGFLYLKEVSPFFAKGLLLESSRWGKRIFTGYEGLLTKKETLEILRQHHSLFTKSISPTRLESYANCPYQYLLEKIMGLEPLTEPEREMTISPSEEGRLIHETLWEFFTELKKERGQFFQLKPGDLDRLMEHARRKFIEFEKTAVTGLAVLWAAKKKNMLEMLADFFVAELKETEFIPAYFEVRYGMKGQDKMESEISTAKPIPLNLAGQTIYLQGRIDRIDLTKDGMRARVRDYKTGKVSAKANEFAGGTILQLPLYLYAASQLLQRLHRGIQVEYAEYYSLKERRSIPFAASQLEQKEAELQKILKTLAKSIEEGIFIPLPDDQKCRYRFCNFRFICGSWTKIIFDQKSGDPKVRGLLDLVRGKAEEEQE